MYLASRILLVLQTALVFLKVSGAVPWSWWIICIPIFFVILIVLITVVGMIAMSDKYEEGYYD